MRMRHVAKKLVEVTVNPSLKMLKDRLRRRTAEYKKDKQPWKAVSIFLDRWVEDNFKSEGGKVGGWESFKAGGRWIKRGNVSRRPGATAGLGRKTKTRVLDKSAKLLQDTGRLRSSFLPFAEVFNAGIGSDIKYSDPHNMGDKSHNLPARRMLPKRSEVIRDAKKIIESMTLKTLKKK